MVRLPIPQGLVKRTPEEKRWLGGMSRSAGCNTNSSSQPQDDSRDERVITAVGQVLCRRGLH